MAINGRKKGNAGEREVLKLFAMWWGGKFERRSMGYQGSDLITPKDFPWSIEVKNVATAKVRHFFKPSKELTAWWQQARDQANKEFKSPILVAKIERQWFVVHLSRPKDLGEDYFFGKLGKDWVSIQTIDSFFLDMDTVKDDIAKAA